MEPEVDRGAHPSLWPRLITHQWIYELLRWDKAPGQSAAGVNPIQWTGTDLSSESGVGFAFFGCVRIWGHGSPIFYGKLYIAMMYGRIRPFDAGMLGG